MESTARRFGLSALVWLALAGALACSGGTDDVVGIDIGTTTLPDLLSQDEGPDATQKDLTADPAAPDPLETDAPADVATPDADTSPSDLSEADADDPCAPGSAGFGCPCSANDECASALCAWSDDGHACTGPCDGECPTGWTCAPLPPSSGTGSVCYSLTPTLCRPCVTSADCNEMWDRPVACLDFGPAKGRFCGGDCGDGDACPAGYACTDATTVDGQVMRQCLPTDGECPCSQHTLDQGLTTVCSVTNMYGACQGTRGCTPFGLGACDAATPSEDLCGDGLDQDCDGTADDGFPDTDADGQLDCVDADDDADGDPDATDCAPLEPAVHHGAAEGCNGHDDDCDGLTDLADPDLADLPRPLCEHQAGPCAGVTKPDALCTADGWLPCPADVYRAVFPAYDAADDDCDGADDDCSGVADDGFVTEPTSCGEGACAATGTRSCVGGAVVDSCQPGTPAPTDASCNDLDDDCNGLTDDGFAASDTACGIGACAATGRLTCTQGALHDSCAPRLPTFDDASCNATDDDCDGATDDDYASTATTCGTGACAAAGATACADGQVLDSCVPGPAAPHDTTCDGVDDDCDGATDDDYVEHTIGCGVGACQAVGTTSCVDGTVVDSCQPGGGAGQDIVCNGVDDDCDGLADDDYAALPSTCGVGACAAAGQKTCVGGVEVDSCLPGQAAPADGTCDGVDDDCDGFTDEDHAPAPTACGVGACARTGQLACVAGQLVDTCETGLPATDDPTCDGLDDDCDGATDDDYVSRDVTCGLGACQATGTTACTDGLESDSCQPLGGAGQDTVCNGVDDDCDGAIDDDVVVTSTSCGVGACRSLGQASCVDGSPTDSCVPGQPAATDPTCDGIDDDCDGTADDDHVPVATTCGTGACLRHGTLTCVAGVPVDSCMAAPAAADDTSCNGVDDDCNGATDDGYVPRPVHCGVGACQALGTTVCDGGTEHDSCQPLGGAGHDTVCNDVDDDCDGATDEDYEPTPTTCGVGACVATGQKTCAGGVEVDSCAAGTPAPSDTSCNGVDDDCDGTVDDGYVPGATACGVGACAATGLKTCADGLETDSCAPGSPAASDGTCNGVDDDCNGATDDGYVATPTTCGLGYCAATGLRSCVGGVELDSCKPGAPLAATDTTCNAIDDDCNGKTDDGFPAGPSTCGVGACAAVGVRSCTGGVATDTCTSGVPSPEVCNGVDDDCNGKTDSADGSNMLKNDRPYCEKQQGVCAGTQKSLALCASGVWWPCTDALYKTLRPAYANPETTACDGADNDCDGQVDESFAPTPTTCGSGPCAATGLTTCTAGVAGDSCIPGTPAPSDATCDGIDDDCNGTADDDYVPPATTCGTGGCTRAGQLLCISGAPYDTCLAGQPAPTDELCNGVDDDCNGATDEDYVPQPTTCGTGACKANGTITCVAGAPVTSCTPGTPAPSDTTCDGIDDNCSGATDEGYVVTATACGVGGCAATGQLTCQYGVVVDTCTPATPKAESCNGLDDNCNGSIDEGEDNAGCTTYYYDGDNDGYADPNTHRCLCKPDPANRYTLTTATDCCDSDGGAHPSPPMAAYSTVPRTCGGFDFNCANGDEKEPLPAGKCQCNGSTCTSCTFVAGWEAGAPACGVSGSWISGCTDGVFSCTAVKTPKIQACR